MRVPDGAPQQTRMPVSNEPNSDGSPPHVDDRLGQLQDSFIRLTTSLIDTMNAEKVRSVFVCESICVLCRMS